SSWGRRTVARAGRATKVRDSVMTAEEWDTATNPDPMLRQLIGTAGPRKKRLFGCGCCPLIWQRLPDERCRRAGPVSEQFADGRATAAELAQARLDGVTAHEEAYRRYQAATGPPGTTWTFPGPPPPWQEPWRAEQAALAAVYVASEHLDDTEEGPYQ